MARLIDAELLLEDNTWEWFDEWGNYTLAGQAIADAPTVDAVEVVHGEWIRKEYNSDHPYYRMECSNCGGRMPRDQMTKEYYSDYCQSCGAKMDGGDE